MEQVLFQFVHLILNCYHHFTHKINVFAPEKVPSCDSRSEGEDRRGNKAEVEGNIACLLNKNTSVTAEQKLAGSQYDPPSCHPSSDDTSLIKTVTF